MDDGAGAAPPSPPNTPPPSPQESPRIARKVQVSAGAVNDDSAPPPIQLPTHLESDETPPPLEEEVEAADDASGAIASSSKDAAKPGLKVVLLIIGVLLCLAFGVWAISFAIQTWNKSAPAEETDSPAQANPAETSQQAPDSTAPNNVVDVPEVIESTPAPDPLVARPAAPEAAPAPVAVEPVIWPMLTINGLVGKGEQGAAMINAQIVGVNETIEGVKVIDIKKQGVTLEFEGEKRFVKVGGSTDE